MICTKHVLLIIAFYNDFDPIALDSEQCGYGNLGGKIFMSMNAHTFNIKKLDVKTQDLSLMSTLHDIGQVSKHRNLARC